MLKLHGFAVSNYFNMVRMALAIKGADYEVVTVFPNQNPDWLSLSPMGKVPCLETERGTLSETAVILEYLDETLPGPKLLPEDAFERAQMRQMMQFIKLYIELPARRLFPGVFFGGVNTAQTKDEVKPVLEKGARAVAQLATFKPYFMGETWSAADCMAMYALDLAAAVATKEYQWDLLDDIPGSKAALAMLAAHPVAQAIDAEKNEQMAKFLAFRSQK